MSECLMLLPILPPGYDERHHCALCGQSPRVCDLWKSNEYGIDPKTGQCFKFGNYGSPPRGSLTPVDLIRAKRGYVDED